MNDLPCLPLERRRMQRSWANRRVEPKSDKVPTVQCIPCQGCAPTSQTLPACQTLPGSSASIPKRSFPQACQACRRAGVPGFQGPRAQGSSFLHRSKSSYRTRATKPNTTNRSSTCASRLKMIRFKLSSCAQTARSRSPLTTF